VENASYCQTMCDERTAFSKAVFMGYKPGDFAAIAFAASVDNISPLFQYLIKATTRWKVWVTGKDGGSYWD
jgi:hypothetical protein